MAERMVLPARSMGRTGEVRTCAMVACIGISVCGAVEGCTASVKSQYTGGGGVGEAGSFRNRLFALAGGEVRFG